jgi:hypothetical protein
VCIESRLSRVRQMGQARTKNKSWSDWRRESHRQSNGSPIFSWNDRDVQRPSRPLATYSISMCILNKLSENSKNILCLEIVRLLPMDKSCGISDLCSWLKLSKAFLLKSTMVMATTMTTMMVKILYIQVCYTCFVLFLMSRRSMLTGIRHLRVPWTQCKADQYESASYFR